MQVVGLLTTVPAHQLRHHPLIREFRDVAIQAEGEVLKVTVKHAETVSEPGQ